MAIRRIQPTKVRRNRSKPASSTESAKRPSRWQHMDWAKVRIGGVTLVFGLLWLVLWARAYQVQLVRGPKYAEDARRQQQATEFITGRRGTIADRNGNVLARSVEGRSVFARPREIKDQQQAAVFLARVLDLPVKQMRAQLASGRAYVWIARKIDQRTAELVKAEAPAGIYLTTEYMRVYPLQHMAGQLLGFVDVDDKGIEGLEMAFESALSGQSKRQVLQRDAAGRRLYGSNDELRDDLTGEDIRLTIDTHVQYFAEEALAKSAAQYGASWAGCLVVEVASGDVLAWAEYPFFNPNRPNESTKFARRNKLAMDALEQGSTIKPFLLAAAMEEKIITKDSQFYCEKGKWKFRDVTIRDTHAYDTLPVNQILRYSSNIGVAKIGLQLGAKRYHDYLTRLGFGSRSALPLAGESKGILRDPRQWAEIDLATASFGQSFSATAVQMAQAYLALADSGRPKNLRVRLEETPQGVDSRDHGTGPLVFSDAVTLQIRSMLREVVEEGTGKAARIPGLGVGGKTGTAQKASGDAYGKGRVGSFVGLFPIEKPRYLVFVVFDEPEKNSYGGVVAAPVFQQVATRTMAYYGLLPDAGEAGPAEAAAGGKAAAKKNAAPGVQTAAAKRDAATAAKRDAATAAKRDAVTAARQAVAQKKSTEAQQPGQPRAGTAPDVTGLSVRNAVELFAKNGLVPAVKGRGSVVVRQSPAPGNQLPNDGAKIDCTLWLGERS